MRKIHGIKGLINYLASMNYPLKEADIHDLIVKREIPHSKLMSNILIFDLNHIDWWIKHNRTKN